MDVPTDLMKVSQQLGGRLLKQLMHNARGFKDPSRQCQDQHPTHQKACNHNYQKELEFRAALRSLLDMNFDVSSSSR